MMFRPHDLAEELRKRPFEPFRIHTTDGASYDIRHPEWVMVSPSRVVIFVPMANEAPPLFERSDSVALIHITRLSPLPSTTPSAAGNGEGT
jgi:hypothetical protein